MLPSPSRQKRAGAGGTASGTGERREREAQREKTITRLLNENEDFAAGTALTCLMLCAGCTSAPPHRRQ